MLSLCFKIYNMKIDKSGHVYLFFNSNSGLHKIGYTSDINKRLSAIISQSGCDISLVYNSDRINNPKEFEHKIHSKLDEFRTIGEWFNIDKESAIEVIKDICSCASVTDILFDYRNGISINELCDKYKLSRSGLVKHIQESGEWKGDGRRPKITQRHAKESIKKLCNIYNPFNFKRVSTNIYTNGKDYLYMIYSKGKFNEYLFDTFDEAKEFRDIKV